MKRISLLIVLSLSFLLFGCGGEEKNIQESEILKEESDISTSEKVNEENITMTEEVFQKAYDDLVNYITELGNYLGEFSILLGEEQDFIRDGNAYFSESEEFYAIKEKVIATCDEMLQYDTDDLSNEMIKCYDKLDELAVLSVKHWEELETTTEMSELDKVVYGYNDDFAAILDELHVFLADATISHMEANNVDQEVIEEYKRIYADIYEETEHADHYSGNTSSFTNKYGTPTTICAYSGCNAYIANSGDTNCCTIHSNKCLNCYDYIDGDAMYCMSCISGSISSSSGSSSYSSGGCQYKYLDGSICGAKTDSYDSLCDRHFNELNETYHSFVGN